MVPLQALFLMNNPWVRARAATFAAGLSGDPDARVAAMVERAWNRPPTTEESRRFCQYVKRYSEGSTRAGASPAEAERDGWSSLALVVLTANAFLYVD
jgi:hypothetical protein